MSSTPFLGQVTRPLVAAIALGIVATSLPGCGASPSQSSEVVPVNLIQEETRPLDKPVRPRQR